MDRIFIIPTSKLCSECCCNDKNDRYYNYTCLEDFNNKSKQYCRIILDPKVSEEVTSGRE